MTKAGPSEGSIYPVREDTRLLARFAEGTRGLTVLEIGTGNGRVAETAARAGARVVATDLHPGALAALRRRALALALPVETVRTDLARGLRRFDRILANPPYLPTPPGARDPDPWANLALDGGPDGCEVLARILALLPEHLAVGGRAYLVESSRQPMARRLELRSAWTARGGTVRRVAEEPMPGEVLEVTEWVPPTPNDPPAGRGRSGTPPD
ncbi:MAG TPA: HemK2/MTQ2 family protein methyltransferase [Thermoplasmata archaeon]|nr:HemK2/MTQ2 family protein methyltransferase [Thermoplasmata archaeon]